MRATVKRNDRESRYELWLDEKVVGIADYRLTGTTATFPHTEVARDRRGMGLGALLVRGALDDARGNGWSVVPACWYVAQFMDGHPEYRDLRATTTSDTTWTHRTSTRG